MRPIGSEHFIELLNYQRLWEDPITIQALTVSVTYVFGSLSVGFALGLVVALCLNEEIHFRGGVRTLTLVPWFIPSVVAAYLWTWLFNPTYGALNSALVQLGLIQSGAQLAWLGDPNLALIAVIMVSVWRDFPFHTVMLLAGLQVIPAAQYEAAIVDGAGVLSRFRNITLPNLRYVIGVDMILMAVWLFKRIDIFYIMTEGGPVYSTLVFPLYIYYIGFHQYDLGLAGAYAVVMLLILMISAVVYMKVWKID
jgi:multiple sugar transport system permease protein